MQDRTITLMDKNGDEILADILFTYHEEETEKDYVVFQIRNTQEVSAACYIEDEAGTGSLEPIETDEEWEMLEDLLAEYAEEMEKQQGCGGCGGGCASCQGGCDCGGDCDCDKE